MMRPLALASLLHLNKRVRSESPEHLVYTFLPKSNILSRNIIYIISELSRQITTDMRHNFKADFNTYFTEKDAILFYDPSLERVLITSTLNNNDAKSIYSLRLEFKQRILNVLGFDSRCKYTSYRAKSDLFTAASKTVALIPQTMMGGVTIF